MKSTLIYDIAGLICHQMPERSIFINNIKLPMCSRCTGIYGSLFIYLVYFLLRKRFKANFPPNTFLLILTIGLLFPFMYDGAMSYAGFYETTNFIRIVTGAFSGLPLSFLIIYLSNINMSSDSKKVPIIKSLTDIFPVLLCQLFAYLTFKELIVWHIASFVSVSGMILFFGTLIFIAGRAVHDKLTKK